MKYVDYIIVGQGLAGSLLGIELILSGYSIQIFDLPSENISSTVAAGLYNPITGRKMVKTWLADELFKDLEAYYARLEKLLDSEFLYPLPMYRPFSDTGQINDFEGRNLCVGSKGFIKKVHYKPILNDKINNEYGGILLNKTGSVDINSLISSARQFFRSRNSFCEEKFDDQEIEIDNESVNYKSLLTRKIIFCNGYLAGQSYWFNWLPFRPTKGELLFLDVDMSKDLIINKKAFLLPLKNNGFKLGSTYSYDLDELKTQKGSDDLQKRLQDLLRLTYNIRGQVGGVRPSTADRRPLIGTHPRFSCLSIFNGFGTKGVTLIPFFVKQFIGQLEKKLPVQIEANIERYYHLYAAENA
ncbi:MAG TPA: NAD(P)/FAD-dependent oxidoreductase [Cyclobacteriaceae bacterium]